MDATREEALQTIRESDLGDRLAVLAEALLPSIRVVPRAPEGRVSHFAGLPRVPRGFKWPFTASEPALPLTFLAQIDLAELPKRPEFRDLPTDGVLYFFDNFSDPDFREEGVVLRYPKETELTVAEPPVDPSTKHGEIILERMTCIDYQPVRFAVEWTLPRDPRPEFCLNDGQLDEDYEELLDNLRMDPTDPQHRILGYPNEIQTNLEIETTDWRLLLQLDSDPDLQWEWGDNGRMFFTIRKDDLVRGDFSKTCFDFQCY